MRTSVPSGNLNALRAVVLTNGAVTHATHMSQRHVTMVTQGVTGPDAEGFVNLTVTACPRAEVCPPGWYLLYVLDGETPSMGQWVQIGGDAGLGPGNFPGF
ncbi:hypothetical protein CAUPRSCDRAFT_12614 [Caulochytrium protostelioides]|nr:hypothetical protein CAUPRSCDRAFT_12614 [Caulochytrium protostelioides]